MGVVIFDRGYKKHKNVERSTTKKYIYNNNHNELGKYKTISYICIYKKIRTYLEDIGVNPNKHLERRGCATSDFGCFFYTRKWTIER